MTDSIDWLPENLQSYLLTGVIDFRKVSLRAQPETTNKATLLDICQVIQDNKLVSGLEIGVLLGISTCVLGAALKENGGTMTGVDPGKRDERWGETRIEDPFSLAEELVALSGLNDSVTLIRDYSSNVFPRFTKESFDLIYIDGDHNYFGVLADFIASDYCLAAEGFLVLDDVNKENAKKDWTDGGPARVLPAIFASGRYEMRYLTQNTMICKKLKSVA